MIPMAERCEKCNRRRIVGLGWQKMFAWEHYCPKCIALLRAERLATEKEAEPRTRGEFARLNAMRHELEAVATGKVTLPECLRAVCVELAGRGLKEVQEDAGNILENMEPDPKIDWFKADGKVGGGWYSKARQLDYIANKIDPVVVPIHRVLADLVAQGDCKDVRTLVAGCLALTQVLKPRPRYFNFKGGFPVDQLVALASLDRAATVGALCAALCDPHKPQEHISIILALGKIGDPHATTALMTLLDDKDWASCAACALSDIGGEEVVVPVALSVRHFASGNYECWNSRDYIVERLGRWVRPGSSTYKKLAIIRDEGHESPELSDPNQVDVLYVMGYVAHKILQNVGGPAGAEAA